MQNNENIPRRYRDIPYGGGVCVGNEMPAFIFACYDDEDILVISHGKFDAWCVYQGSPLEKTDRREYLDYPLLLDEIKVNNLAGSRRDTLSFIGSFTEYALIEFDFSAPLDTDYFGELRRLASIYGKERVWNDFLRLYELVPQTPNASFSGEMLHAIQEIADSYKQETQVKFTFDCLLAAMIAENNKEHAILGKKVKALGVHQTIFDDDKTLYEIANWSKGKPWRVIDAELKRRGINTPNLSR